MKIEEVFNCLGSNEENKFYNLQNQIYKMQFTIQDWYTIYGKGIKGLGQSSDLKSHESNYAFPVYCIPILNYGLHFIYLIL